MEAPLCLGGSGTRGAYISTTSQIYNLQRKSEPTAAAVAYRTVSFVGVSAEGAVSDLRRLRLFHSKWPAV